MEKSHFEKMFDVFQDRRRLHRRLLFEGIVIGLIAGAVVSAFRFFVEWAENQYAALALWLSASNFHLFFYAVLLVGAGLLLAKSIAIEPIIAGSGIPQVKGRLLGELAFYWPRVLVLKFLGSLVSLGLGMSLGRMGPSVLLGSTVGQGISRLEKRTPFEERFLLTAGAGAGLAAAFNAPLAGVVFALEILSHSFSSLVFMGAIAASVTATFFSRTLFGASPVFRIPLLADWPLDIGYVFFIALGVFVGCLAAFFTKTLIKSQDWYVKNLPPYVRPLPPLFITGALLFILPVILGGGSHLVNHLVALDYSLVTPPWLFVLFGLYLAKFFFTAICFGSGVPGGTFLPMLSLGASLGAVFAAALLLGGFLAEAHYAATFIVFGMAGYFSAVVKAPVTGSILIMEITGSFAHMLPLILVCLSAYIVCDSLGTPPLYDALLGRVLRLKRALMARQMALNRQNPALKDDKKAEKKRRLIIELAVAPGAIIAEKALKEISFPAASLVINIRRDEADIVPTSSTVLTVGDYLYILTYEDAVAELNELVAERE